MQKNRRTIRDTAKRLAALGLACLTLYLAYLTAGANSLREASIAVSEAEFARSILRRELGDFGEGSRLSFGAALALSASPMLRLSESRITAELPSGETEAAESPVPLEAESSLSPSVPIVDNGVAARTLLPVSSRSYLVYDKVYISTSTAYTEKDIAYGGSFPVKLVATAEPQVLIYHTHGSEAYTPPPGESYEPSGDHRTRDTAQNVVRVGDELAQVLAERGIAVLHDRTLYDDPDYNEAYNRSLKAVDAYLKKYPSIRLVLDIHRDAVSDGKGGICKVLADEGASSPAQMTLVMGSDAGGLYFPDWRDNLHLAIALQQHIAAEHPTLMRPLLLRKSRYNQHLSPGALLIEVGAAGNSLAEALASARILGKHLAELTLN